MGNQYDGFVAWNTRLANKLCVLLLKVRGAASAAGGFNLTKFSRSVLPQDKLFAKIMCHRRVAGGF
jgi:hypothetical protein